MEKEISSPEYRCLVIDDDEKLQNLLSDYLNKFGFKVSSIFNGNDVIEKIKLHKPDIIVLDIMLGDIDGIEVLKSIRSDSNKQVQNVPILMLTARGEDSDRIVGLELGADDYLTKPFQPRELVARLKAILRRNNQNHLNINESVNNSANLPNNSEAIAYGDLILNLQSHSIIYKENEIELSSTEFKLLEILMNKPKKIFSRNELLDMVSGREFMSFDRSIDMHISKVRSKLFNVSGTKEYIKTYWGTGYMFNGELK